MTATSTPFVANNSQANQVLINDGSGVFTASDLAGGARISYGVALGDLDGDGDLDALVANQTQANQILVNDGSGVFTASDVSGGAQFSLALALGDLDGDGGGVLPPDPAMAVGPSLQSLMVEPVDPGAGVA